MFANLESYRFVLDHWTPISREEANRRVEGIAENRHGVDYHYLECDLFDPVASLCTAHETRPSICRGFPHYGGAVEPYALDIYPRCSFWHEIERSLWPHGIAPLPDPEVTHAEKR